MAGGRRLRNAAAVTRSAGQVSNPARPELAGEVEAGQPASSSSSAIRAVEQATGSLGEAIDELRGAVVALHPATRAAGGVAAALSAVAEVQARRCGFALTLEVAAEATGVRDQLIVSVAQELLNNVAQHAQARRVTVSLRRAGAGIVFEVSDDGCGIASGRREQALADGHIGLASIALRTESAGGRFELVTSPGRGTRVRLTFPAREPDR